MGIFGSVLKKATKPVAAKISTKLSEQSGKKIDLTKAKITVDVAKSAAGALQMAGAASQLVPGIGTGVGAALVAAGAGINALSKGDKAGAAMAGLGAIAPGLGGAASSVATAAGAAQQFAQVKQAVNTAKKTLSTASVSQATQLAVKGLAKDTAAKAKGVTVAADRIIAAVEQGGKVAAAAKSTLVQTQKLADKGNKDAQRALQLVSTVAKQRAAAGVPVGTKQPVTASAEKALKQVLKSVPKDPPGKVIKTTGFDAIARSVLNPVDLPAPPVDFAVAPYFPRYVVDAGGRVHIAKAWVATQDTSGIHGVLVDPSKPPAERVGKATQYWTPING